MVEIQGQDLASTFDPLVSDWLRELALQTCEACGFEFLAFSSLPRGWCKERIY
jgi:hypothetical protein